MVRSLNKYLVLCLMLLLSLRSFSQKEDPKVLDDRKDREKDYQDKKGFDKFKKRSAQVSAWQIQNLKFGAIVVRLQNNQRKIDAYRKMDDKNNLYETMARTQFLNKTMIRSVLKEVDFCKVYFIYAQSSDSLLKGKKQGIFLDSTLKVDPNITMTENYYVLMETDYVYNSSIGFVEEDSARKVSETGPQTVFAPFVLKNKYGHQLKDPFPFYTNKMTALKKSQFTVTEKIEAEPGEFKNINLELKREYSETYWLYYASSINYNLQRFYERNAGVQVKDANLKPFLY
jgi:hypothetical protein